MGRGRKRCDVHVPGSVGATRDRQPGRGSLTKAGVCCGRYILTRGHPNETLSRQPAGPSRALQAQAGRRDYARRMGDADRDRGDGVTDEEISVTDEETSVRDEGVVSEVEYAAHEEDAARYVRNMWKT